MDEQELQEWTAELTDTAHKMIRGATNGQIDTTEGVWGDPVVVSNTPMHAIVLTLETGPAEHDSLLVVGFVNPHDGNLTTVVNHLDGILTHDNAEEMFPPSMTADEQLMIALHKRFDYTSDNNRDLSDGTGNYADDQAEIDVTHAYLTIINYLTYQGD